uniref:Uncharacterized protein n=1 Tax=Pyramimonas orientalis virus TaxID=455367 RepID=A0A7M3UNQ6_POV01|nr:hypothetical protein HWQ62_00196 [Pyramimonas orientalis virus]
MKDLYKYVVLVVCTLLIIVLVYKKVMYKEELCVNHPLHHDSKYECGNSTKCTRKECHKIIHKDVYEQCRKKMSEAECVERDMAIAWTSYIFP